MKRQDREMCACWPQNLLHGDAAYNNHMTARSAYIQQDKQGQSSLHTQQEDMKMAKLRFQFETAHVTWTTGC